MVLNLLIVTSQFLTAGITFLSAGIVFRQRIETKNRWLTLFFTHWLLWGISWLIAAFSQLFVDPFLMRFVAIPQVIGLFCLLIFLENISGTHIGSVKVGLLSFVVALYVWSSWLPDANYIIPDYGVHVSGLNRYTQILFLAFYVAIYFGWIYPTWRKSPPKLKRAATWLLLGATFMSFASIIVYFLGTILIPLGAFPYLVHSSGVFITVLVMWRHPKLIYILPFTAHRLIVIHRSSGLLLFEHKWSDHDTNQDILSGVIHGLQNISTETFQVGEPQQFNLQEGVLIFQSKNDITTCIISSKTSQYLSESLKQFTLDFARKIKDISVKLDDVLRAHEFTSLGEQLTVRHFTYVPSRLA